MSTRVKKNVEAIGRQSQSTQNVSGTSEEMKAVSASLKEELEQSKLALNRHQKGEKNPRRAPSGPISRTHALPPGRQRGSRVRLRLPEGLHAIEPIDTIYA